MHDIFECQNIVIIIPQLNVQNIPKFLVAKIIYSQKYIENYQINYIILIKCL